MPTELTKNAIERSTFVVTAAFSDHDGNPVVPKTGLKWSLTDRAGNVINNRNNVVITPAASINIVLSGADLALPSAADSVRVVTIEGTYDSTLGSDLPINDEITFRIISLTKVS